MQDHNVIPINNLVVLLVYSFHCHGVSKHTYTLFTTFLLDLLTGKTSISSKSQSLSVCLSSLNPCIQHNV